MGGIVDDCWGAFGSDGESDDDVHVDVERGPLAPNFEPVTDATALAITRHFASLAKSTGVPPTERVVGIAAPCRRGDDHDEDRIVESRGVMMAERIRGRGMKTLEMTPGGDDRAMCDAAIILKGDRSVVVDEGAGAIRSSRRVRRSLLPGGVLWLIVALEENGGWSAVGGADEGVFIQRELMGYSEAIWDVESASVAHSSPGFGVISVTKRACSINAWSCPWMEKERRIGNQLSTRNGNAFGDFPTPLAEESYLQYERRAACAVTICPSVAERDGGSGRIAEFGASEELAAATILTEQNVRRATEILREHGLVVVRGLLPPSQTIAWGDAVLSDFNLAVELLRRHPTRPVDLMNPRTTVGGGAGRIFEPLNYKEMAMREDLRVDLRSGPEMEALRRTENDAAFHLMTGGPSPNDEKLSMNDLNEGASIVGADMLGNPASWRFHTSILSIIRSLFNPRNDLLYKGNFGRWNFGGAGPDGSPQPLRLGQIGSVLSCPGAGDQAIHADTPHLFEHVDCLPCHYCNVFTPGYGVIHDPCNDCFGNEFDPDGSWTGNSTMGGTALVLGSHRLRTSALLLDDDAGEEMDTNGANGHYDKPLRRQLLQLRTLRPALNAGDVLIFDCRTIHFGAANKSQGDVEGKDPNVGRRPMLYLNVTQSWFHDPKNWDNRKRIFDGLKGWSA